MTRHFDGLHEYRKGRNATVPPSCLWKKKSDVVFPEVPTLHVTPHTSHSPQKGTLMNGKISINTTGNLVAEPELLFTKQGHAVANFTIAANPRTFNTAANRWEDGSPVFLRCKAWRDTAENLAASELKKGTRIMIEGVLTQRSWNDDAGSKHTIDEVNVDEVGPSLRSAQATVRKITKQRNSSTNTNTSSNAVSAADSGNVTDKEPPF